MSELAFDEDGQHFQVPATVARWRTRRFNNPGKPGGAQVVYGDDGLPLFLDVGTTADEFREAVQGVPGRYRLDGVDVHGRLVDGVPPAYLMINGGATASASSYNAAPPPAGTSLEYALVEMARANCDAIKTMADKFGGICDSVANVVRAADGAGLPRRAPLGPLLLDQPEQDDDDDVDDDERNAAPRPSERPTVATVLSQVMQMVQVFAQMRGGDPVKVGALMAPVVETAKVVEAATASISATSRVAEPTNEEDDDADAERSRASSSRTIRATPAGAPAPDLGAPPSGAAAADPMAHFNQIMIALTPAEQARVQYVITTLSVRDLMQWYEQLAGLPILDAVAKIRAELARVPMEQAA